MAAATLGHVIDHIAIAQLYLPLSQGQSLEFSKSKIWKLKFFKTWKWICDEKIKLRVVGNHYIIVSTNGIFELNYCILFLNKKMEGLSSPSLHLLYDCYTLKILDFVKVIWVVHLLVWYVYLVLKSESVFLGQSVRVEMSCKSKYKTIFYFLLYT